MTEQQMITSIEFPTWNQLSNPVKSFLTFFMEGASVFFRKVTVEDAEAEGSERSFPCGVIASDLRTINYMYAWGYDHTGYNRWDANMSCELFPAIKCISADHLVEDDYKDSQLVGFCYLKAFKSRNNEEVTENDLDYILHKP